MIVIFKFFAGVFISSSLVQCNQKQSSSNSVGHPWGWLWWNQQGLVFFHFSVAEAEGLFFPKSWWSFDGFRRRTVPLSTMKIWLWFLNKVCNPPHSLLSSLSKSRLSTDLGISPRGSLPPAFQDLSKFSWLSKALTINPMISSVINFGTLVQFLT